MKLSQKLFGEVEPKQYVRRDAKYLLEKGKCYDWGENLVRVIDEERWEGYLVNKATGKVRMIDSLGFLVSYLVGFSDEDIDFATLDTLPNSENAHTRKIENIAKIDCWDKCQNGLFALRWVLCPDWRYYADGYGTGTQYKEQLAVYCIMDDDLNIVRPFTVVDDIRALLRELREAG